MVSENHHLTINTKSAKVDGTSLIARTHHHHTHIEVDSQMRSQPPPLPQQQHHHHRHHHHRLLNPEYQHKSFSRSRSRSPYSASPHRHAQEDCRHTAKEFFDGVSPDALAQRLEFLEAGQSHLQSNPAAELQRKNEEMLQDIIERLDKTISEQDSLDLDVSAETTTLLQEQNHQLNPALLKDQRTLQQHHGNANIRHS
ncbi:hypothetical protein BGZ75_000383 [Mortierella antarctica]|nr:hypothetical protein BGZ75_000383 [Mortierella antarctica]